MILLLDIGNTCIKWAQLLDGRLTPQQSLIHRGVAPEVWMKQLFRERFRPARLLVANVAGAQMSERIAIEAQRLWQTAPQFATVSAFSAGVTHAYKEVATHGVDRWLAVIAAYRLAGGAACVVDAGTAVTVDAVDAKGLHLGGLIIPGLQMMIGALLENTGDIAARARQLSAVGGLTTSSGVSNLLAVSTAGGVVNGAMLAIAAAADRAIAEVSRRTGSTPRVFITGGDAPRIQKLMQTPGEYVPDLVLQGLALTAQA